MRVLISGTCAQALNSNYELIEAITCGFRRLNGPEVQLVTVTQLAEAIEGWKPHLTLLVGGLGLETIPLAIVNHLCNITGGKLAFWSLEDPYELDWVVRKGTIFDLICTTDFSSRCFYPGEWLVQHLPLASPDMPAPQNGGKSKGTACWLFCGVPFQNRINWIEAIRENHPNGLLIGPKWKKYGKPTQVNKNRISREVLLTLYRTMPITLSIGRRYDIANSAKISPSTPGPRLFEAAGCGAAQLVCESGHETCCYYEPNSEFLWARNVNEADECLQRLSKDSELINRIAKQAWKRTQAEHLYSHRAKQILSWISDL